MARYIAMSLLLLLAAVVLEAQSMPSFPAFDAGRAQLTAGNPLEAAAAFEKALRETGANRVTLRVAVYCELSNLVGHVRASGNPPGLFVLRRSVGGRPCLALYWGLFPSTDVARGALPSVPAPLRTRGQSPVPVSEIMPPGAPPPLEAAAVLPSAAVAERQAPQPPVVPLAREEPAPESRPATPKVASPVAPPVAEQEPIATVPLLEAEPDRPPAMEVTASYSVLRDRESLRESSDGLYKIGWMLQLCGNLNQWLGVVGDVSGHYGANGGNSVGTSFSLGRDVLAVHAGPRLTLRWKRLTGFYAQALGGWTRTGFDLADRRLVDDAFSIQPGLGLNLQLSKSVGFGLGADYRLIFGREENRNELRLHAGLVFAIGVR